MTIKKTFILFFIFCISLTNYSFAENIEAKKIILSRLDPKRIEPKCKYYESLAQKTKNFRRNVCLLTAVTAMGLTAFAGYKIYNLYANKKGNEAKPAENNVNSTTQNFNLEEVLQKNLLKKKYVWEVGCWNVFKHGLIKGLTKGWLWGIASIVSVSCFSIWSKMLGFGQEKFLDLWKGQDLKHFIGARKLVGINLEQLGSLFLLSNNDFYDKEEIKDNYLVFIDALETIIALTLFKALSSLESGNQSAQAILSSQESLYKKILIFTQELEEALNVDDNSFLSNELSSSVFVSFKHLNNQLVRFINLSSSVLYENGNVS